MRSHEVAELLSASDPFLVTATQALIARDGRERSAAIRRLFDLRVQPTSHLSPSDRALRLVATGCLYLALDELERRSAREQSSDVAPTIGCASRSHPGDGGRRRGARQRRNTRAELRVLFAAIAACSEQPAALFNETHNVATLDLQHPAPALLRAIVDDARTWRTDQAVREELNDLLTEPAER